MVLPTATTVIALAARTAARPARVRLRIIGVSLAGSVRQDGPGVEPRAVVGQGGEAERLSDLDQDVVRVDRNVRGVDVEGDPQVFRLKAELAPSFATVQPPEASLAALHRRARRAR